MNLNGQRAFSLIELSIVVGAAAIMAGAIMPSFLRSAYIEAGKKMAIEIEQIKDAARASFIKNQKWPVDIASMQADGFLDTAWQGKTVFGHSYILDQNGTSLRILSTVPELFSEIITGILPMSSYDGGSVIVPVTPPELKEDVFPTGAIMSWPGAAIPEGWLLCNGREVSRAEYAALFDLIGINYGSGDGVATFNIPDLRGRTVVGLDNMGGSAANVIQAEWARNLGAQAGEEQHALTVNEMPSHQHYGFGEKYPSWNFGVFEVQDIKGPDLKDRYRYFLGTSFTGKNEGHNNIQPSIAMNWIIKG